MDASRTIAGEGNGVRTVSAAALPAPGGLAGYWSLDPSVVFMNHGSFGACPRAVLDVQREFADRMEREPVRFFVEDLEGLLDHAREVLGRFVNADPEGMVFVPNATAGVNAVVASMHLAPGDELLANDQEYNACVNTLRRHADRAGARVVIAPVPFPIRSAEEAAEAVLARVTERTRLALISHVTSPTALVLPVERLVRELAARGVQTLVDGAHAPGMIDLDIAALAALGLTYYTANCHKWMCAPKGSAFLWVSPSHRLRTLPHITSHGANSTRTDRARLHLEFDWPGTLDPTPILSVPAAIEVVGGLVPGGWPEIRSRNRAQALAARDLLCRTLGCAPPAPESMIGSIASVVLPPSSLGPRPFPYPHALQDRLVNEARVQAPVFPWPAHPARLLRVSAQLYNSPEQYEYLAAALPRLLEGT